MTQLHLIMSTVKSQINKVIYVRNDYVDLRNGCFEFTLVLYVSSIIFIMSGKSA